MIVSHALVSRKTCTHHRKKNDHNDAKTRNDIKDERIAPRDRERAAKLEPEDNANENPDSQICICRHYMQMKRSSEERV